jgi:F0F1-type ATP synthase assembly protein I
MAISEDQQPRPQNIRWILLFVLGGAAILIAAALFAFQKKQFQQQPPL